MIKLILGTFYTLLSKQQTILCPPKKLVALSFVIFSMMFYVRLRFFLQWVCFIFRHVVWFENWIVYFRNMFNPFDVCRGAYKTTITVTFIFVGFRVPYFTPFIWDQEYIEFVASYPSFHITYLFNWNHYCYMNLQHSESWKWVE